MHWMAICRARMGWTAARREPVCWRTLRLLVVRREPACGQPACEPIRQASTEYPPGRHVLTEHWFARCGSAFHRKRLCAEDGRSVCRAQVPELTGKRRLCGALRLEARVKQRSMCEWPMHARQRRGQARMPEQAKQAWHPG